MLKVRNIKVNVDNDKKNILIEKLLHKLKINKEEIIDYDIVKKSLDARDKENIFYVYEVDINIKNEIKVLKRKIKDVIKTEKVKYSYEITGTKKMINRPIIVGSGPAGLFCAYHLAKNGYNPIIIERGKKVEERVKDIEKFWQENILDEDSNVQFGEGGAGTFSDGKLATTIKDKEGRIKEILDIFVKHGGDPEIKYISKPHIGTDKLREIIKSMREYIISHGGTYLFNTTLTDIIIEDNKIKKIEVNNKEYLDCDVLVLALGNSARDTFRKLSTKIKMQNKPFAVGIRIIHNQELINKSQYGKMWNKLPPASYKLTYQTKEKRGVYSFCMCPGGFVVNASSFNKKLVVNGMSNSKRDEVAANSAIVVTVSEKDYGENLLDGIKYQEHLEEKAYVIGNSKIPIMTYGEFKKNKIKDGLGTTPPIIKGKYKKANVREIFPEYINEALIEAVENFDKKIKGFNNDDSLIIGVESRTSSPIRIIRDENFISSVKGIYPAGEGAGYAGGITSSAVDGMKVFESIVKEYKS